MIDDTPEVKWSNAWWGRLAFGMIAPALLTIWAIYSFFTESAYALGSMGQGFIAVPIFGFEAKVMAFAYLGAAISSFAYFYARHSPRLNGVYEVVQAAGLLLCAGCMIWSYSLFLLG